MVDEPTVTVHVYACPAAPAAVLAVAGPAAAVTWTVVAAEVVQVSGASRADEADGAGETDEADEIDEVDAADGYGEVDVPTGVSVRVGGAFTAAGPEPVWLAEPVAVMAGNCAMVPR